MGENKIRAARAQQGPSDPNVETGWTGPNRPAKYLETVPTPVVTKTGLSSRIRALAVKAYQTLTAG